MEIDGRPVLAFRDAAELRAWMEANAAEHPGGWVRLAKAGSGIPSITFLGAARRR